MAETDSKAEGIDHSGGNGFPVQDRAVITAFGFIGMAKSMAEIEQGPLAAFTFISGDNRRFGPAAMGDCLTEMLIISRQHACPVVFEPGKERSITEQPVFDHLGVAGMDFGAGSSAYPYRRAPLRLIERPDQILADAGIDAGLAADRTVNLGQQGRRD